MAKNYKFFKSYSDRLAYDKAKKEEARRLSDQVRSETITKLEAGPKPKEQHNVKSKNYLNNGVKCVDDWIQPGSSGKDK